MDWKDFYIKYKWMPTNILKRKFGIEDYDVNNFKSSLPSFIRNEFNEKKISLSLTQERMTGILHEGWKYYLEQEMGINFNDEPSKWLHSLLNLTASKVSDDGFSFLVNSRYLKIAYGEIYDEFINTGYTTVAFCVYECYPTKEFVVKHNILPIMFTQTGKKVLHHFDLTSFLEHIYFNFLGNPEDENLNIGINDRKERFVIRYRERGFINKDMLIPYGLTPHFCSQVGGLNRLLEEVARKFYSDLGFNGTSKDNWNAERYRRMYSNNDFSKCIYCEISPVDLHHLLPRSEFANLIFHEQNVVPLCLQVHSRITRNLWNEQERDLYKLAINKWLSSKSPSKEIFNGVMSLLHENVYGKIIAH